MAIYGYARVSTDDQDLSLQFDALNKSGVDKIFTDKMSGTKSDRPGLKEMVQLLKQGDTVVVYKLDRLGRSLSNLISTMDWFAKKGIGFRSIRESIDTTTSTGKLMFNLLASLAEFERDLISERTKAGLQARKDRGVILGRPKTKEKQLELARKLYAQGAPVKEIIDVTGLSKAWVYRKVII